MALWVIHSALHTQQNAIWDSFIIWQSLCWNRSLFSVRLSIGTFAYRHDLLLVSIFLSAKIHLNVLAFWWMIRGKTTKINSRWYIYIFSTLMTKHTLLFCLFWQYGKWNLKNYSTGGSFGIFSWPLDWVCGLKEYSYMQNHNHGECWLSGQE